MSIRGLPDQPSSFRWPACPVYWSPDSSGVDRLCPEEATLLRFPPIEFSITGFGYSWDARVYEGLRQFHQGKGLDPYSQNVAQHLGLPLVQLPSQRDVPFAYVNSDGEDSDADMDSECNPAHIDDYESEHPHTSSWDDDDLDVDTEFLRSQETVHETVSRDTNRKNDASESIVEEDVARQLAHPLCHFLTATLLMLSRPQQRMRMFTNFLRCRSSALERGDVSKCEHHRGERIRSAGWVLASEPTLGASTAHETYTIYKDIHELPLLWSFKFLMTTQLL
ncbi:hypothetical protein C8R45DRAFT_1096302 [Mycena sanguinolenta]|nr:hypothetical protein C8R45DRAFT_1096302 [Mycena sanguinolenta]